VCEWGTDRVIYVIRRNHDAIPDGWHPVAVDACIADYVQKMNKQGIITVGCCCSHGHGMPVALVAIESIPLLDQYGYEHHPFEDRNDVAEHTIPVGFQNGIGSPPAPPMHGGLLAPHSRGLRGEKS
jgi:hypothetical protein